MHHRRFASSVLLLALGCGADAPDDQLTTLDATGDASATDESGDATASGDETGDTTSETGDGDGDGGDGDGTAGDGTSGDGDGTSGDGDGTAGDGTSGDGDGTSGDGDGSSGDGDGSSGDGDGTSGDGDGTSGDGDGTSGDGDGTSGDGDGTSGDGDGDGTGGDGDGDGSTGDGSTGDGDGSTGDGDGSTGDGDGTTGDGTTGDGDGTTGDGTTGDGTTGDGDGTTGDGTTGDGDGTTGDGTTGDGDGTTGDGDGTTGDGDGTTGDGDGTTGDGDGTPCLSQQPTVSIVPPNLVLVVDKSGSMLADFDGGTRWDSLVTVVDTVTAQWQDRIKFGVKWFPTEERCENGTVWVCGNPPCTNVTAEGDSCEVAAGFDGNNLEPRLNNRNSILNALPNANQIDGYCWTPTDFGHLRSYEAMMDVITPGEEAALMLIIDGAISDGQQTCIGPQNPESGNQAVTSEARLLNSIDAALSNDVPTYVVAIDAGGAGTEQQADSYAVAGGRPNPDPQYDYYPGDDLVQLEAAMNAIAASVATCDIQLDVPPPFPNLVDVTVDGGLATQISAAACNSGGDGWYYSTQYTTITLCGAVCDTFKALSTPTAQVDYFCVSG